jgi:hypothetical protein
MSSCLYPNRRQLLFVMIVGDAVSALLRKPAVCIAGEIIMTCVSTPGAAGRALLIH